jgi:hypothetical protein
LVEWSGGVIVVEMRFFFLSGLPIRAEKVFPASRIGLVPGFNVPGALEHCVQFLEFLEVKGLWDTDSDLEFTAIP